MSITADQRKQIQFWIQGKGLSETCLACNTKASRTVEDEIVVSPIESTGGMILSDKTVPMVQVICSNCGYVMHFSAAVIGIPAE